MTLIECFSNLKNMRHAQGASKEDIAAAEKKLDLHFANDYREYLLTYGVLSAKGIELTGIISSSRINVVDVTQTERNLNSDFPRDMYVIENLAIDGILLLQKSDGSIFEFAPHKKPVKVYNNLADYLKTKI